MANLMQSAQVEQILTDSGIPSVSLHQRGLVLLAEIFLDWRIIVNADAGKTARRCDRSDVPVGILREARS
jgi:hypothetical protein